MNLIGPHTNANDHDMAGNMLFIFHPMFCCNNMSVWLSISAYTITNIDFLYLLSYHNH